MNQNPQKIVACTYWEGEFRGREKIYRPSWVTRLKNMVARVSPDAEFYCLTNVPEKLDASIISMPLRFGLPGWWAKLEILRPFLFPYGARVLNLDLDLLVMQDLAPLFDHPGGFTIGSSVGPFNRVVTRGSHMAGVFAFNAEAELPRRIWSCFLSNPKRYMKDFRGDGRFLDLFTDEFTRYPDGWITKLRYCPGKGTAPDPAAVIIHCMPDKNNIAAKKHEWINNIWKWEAKHA